MGAAQALPTGPVPGVAWCDEASVDTATPQLIEFGCDTGEVRPGARASGCTLNFLLSDGVDLYAATAGHCGGLGKTYHVPGVGPIGQVVFRQFDSNLLNLKDWALIRIDEEAAAKVNPTLYQWGGPVAGPVFGTVRVPVPGDSVYHYGHGRGFGEEDATRARAGIVAAPVGTTAFVWPGTVGPGDSGSPVRLGTGEAAGIAVIGGVIITGDNEEFLASQCASLDDAASWEGSCDALWEVCRHLDGACEAPFHDQGLYGVVIATRLDAALAAFEGYLGRPVWVIEGEPPFV